MSFNPRFADVEQTRQPLSYPRFWPKREFFTVYFGIINGEETAFTKSCYIERSTGMPVKDAVPVNLKIMESEDFAFMEEAVLGFYPNQVLRVSIGQFDEDIYYLHLHLLDRSVACHAMEVRENSKGSKYAVVSRKPIPK